MTYRGIIHFHSSFSHDCFLTPGKILELAEKANLNFLVLSDHETIQGSVTLKNLAGQRNSRIEIPLAAEYKTEYGDIVAAFIEKEITVTGFKDFVAEVRKQGGIILFPHPYVTHKNIDRIAGEVDLIEVFNPRSNRENNEKALLLADKLRKKVYYGSDSHLSKTFLDVLVELPKQGGLKESLLNNEISCLKQRKSSELDLIRSQYIKAMKTRNLELFKWLVTSSAEKLIKGSLFKKI